MFIDEIQDVLKITNNDIANILGLVGASPVASWKNGNTISSNYKKKLNILYNSIKDPEELLIIKKILKNKNAISILGAILFVGSLLKEQQEESITSTTAENGRIVLEKKTIITPVTIRTILTSEQMRALKILITVANKKQ